MIFWAISIIYLFLGICFAIASFWAAEVKQTLRGGPFSKIIYFIIVTAVWLPIIIVGLFTRLLA